MSIDYSKFAFPKPPKKEKKNRQQIKGKKHKRTKQTDIDPKIKVIVWERDNHKCIFCGKKVSWKNANSHYIPRSAGGLGVPKNIVTACEKCHHEQDNGSNTAYYDEKARKYLKKVYGDDWCEKSLIYRKYDF